MSKKNILEESSINEDFIPNNLGQKKNSYFNNNLSNSKFTFLKKLNEFEKNGFEFLNLDSKSGKSKDKEKSNEKEKDTCSFINKSSKINNSKNNYSNSSNSSNSNSSQSSSDNENKKDFSHDNSKYSMHSNINNIKKNYILVKKDGRNSTIFEVKGEENINSNNTNTKKIIHIYEGFFSNPKNNPFLYNLSFNDGKDFNYIHEFWKALALTNECMIKYVKGEIKYMSTSPDDLELVKAAARQGYKLIETNLNTKTLKIYGKDYSYEVLKVLGFSCSIFPF